MAEASKRGGSYRVSGAAKGLSVLVCQKCEERKQDGLEVGSISSVLKSNDAVAEELKRISNHLDSSPISCPNKVCDSNIGKTLQSIKKNGKTTTGNQRLKCLVCGKGFSARPKRRKHTKSHVDKMLFKLLISKSPIQRIAFVCDISTKTVYDKIRFIYRQCQSFAAERERELAEKPFRRFYLSTDRQVVTSNWTQRADKRNCDVYGIATACHKSGYVFAFNFNFDGDIDANEIEQDAIRINDYETPRHHRKYARIWLKREFEEVSKNTPSKENLPVGGSLRDDVLIKTEADQQLNIYDSSEAFDRTNMLPAKGALIHNEYTMIAHFYLLNRFFQNTEKTRFYMDLDSGMKSAYVSAFRELIAEGRSDGFLVRASKNMTNDEKEKRVGQFKRMIAGITKIPVKQLTYVIIRDAVNDIIIERLKKPIRISHSPERWIEHPAASKAEPEKMVAAITDIEELEASHQANLYRKATLAPVDRFFMRIRRFSTYFERPFSSGTSKGRTWYGYSAYDPTMYTMVGEIFRVYYNYCGSKKSIATPAMKLGLAKGPVTIEKIIYFDKYRD